jgi:diaminohydroxyphosphoribosylaminopyrimidine deaminase/5-amino-6-(5-phosphoribosylamino)uracil reductase
MSEDKKWMRRAIKLAERGIGTTSPNPRVGAVVVLGGKVVGEGFHQRAGEDHAEVIALKRAGSRARGATLYVSLEPCATVGKTPPCTEAILAAGVKRVVYGATDPNPANRNRAARIFKSKGVQVVSGICSEESEAMNRPFNSWMTQHRPWVTLKLAASLDGRIATRTGESKWITSPESRQKVQELRYAADAILVGANTVRRDNPHLGVRGPRKKQILKVILGTSRGIGPKARIFASGDPVIFASPKPGKKGRVNLRGLLRELGRRGAAHVLIEGGGETAASFLEAGLVDEVYWFLAPKLIGGRSAVPSVGGKGISRMSKALIFCNMTVKKIGPDYLFHGSLERFE